MAKPATKGSNSADKYLYWGLFIVVAFIIIIFSSSFIERTMRVTGYAIVESEGASNLSFDGDKGLPVFNLNLIQLRQRAPTAIMGFQLVSEKDYTDQYAAGDMVAYYSTSYGLFITHRITSIDHQTGMFVAQGDDRYTNPSGDPAESVDNIIGRVVTVDLGIFKMPLYVNLSFVVFTLPVSLLLIVLLAGHDVLEETVRGRGGRKNLIGELIIIAAIISVVFALLLTFLLG